jgi:chromosome segregation protein
MHLKALEIQGFKSFPERTVLEFHEGVTAIIGPNGSGKSNVTDAIRWVMGEQSVRALRGSRMEDVIFTGTQSRRPMSFAEVTIIIDNSDGKLAVDYTEIQVTRRLYRSGESEYLLNKNLCRLRDITQLFMDTGLGRDGYSIVGQGRVDEILSPRSEDRRRIFEEASGIVKFKTRKEEAERKLAATEQNLVRINDLVQELTGRLAPLAAQAESARRFVALRDELKGIEIGLILDQVEQQQLRFAEAEEERALLQADLAEANRGLLDLREQNRQSTEQLHQIEASIDARQSDYNELSSQVGACNSQIALTDERVQHLRQRLENSAQEEQELSGSLGNLEQELAVRRQKADVLRRQLTQYQVRLSEADNEMAQLLQTLGVAERAIETDKSRLDQIMEALFEQRTLLAQTHNQTALVESRRKQIAQEQRELISDQDRLLLLAEETAAELDRIARQRQELGQARDQAARLLEQNRTECSRLSTQIEQNRQSLRNRQYRLQTLRELERSHEGYGEAVKFLLGQTERDPAQSSGVRGTVGSLIRVDQACELAIETALGPAIQNIVTDTEETAARLIDLLKKNRAGRATFLPLASIRGRELEPQLVDKLSGMVGWVGLASRLVTAASELEPIIRFLLGRVVVAETLDQAIQMARRCQYACRIVTLEGDVLNPGGSLSGGYNRQSGSGVLSRSREIESLDQSVTELQTAVQLSETTLKDREQTLQEHARQMAELERQINDLSHLQIREETRQAAQEQEQARVRGRQQLLQSEDEQLLQQREKINKELARIDAQICAIDQESSQIRTRINLQEGANRSEQAKRDDLREQITEWRVSLQSIEESLQSAEEMISRIELDRTGQQNRLQRQQREQTEHQAEITRLVAERVRMLDQAEHLQQAGLQLAEAVRGLIADKGRLERDQAHYFDSLETMTTRLATLQNEIGKVDARVSRIEGLVDDAKNRLWEDYELTVDQSRTWRQESVNRPELTRRVAALKNEIKGLGTVNLAAIEEYASVSERCQFMIGQRDDIEASRHKLNEVIVDLTTAMKQQFLEHFSLINDNFRLVFAELFGGGMAEIHLEDDQDVLTCGIEIKAQPPGKKLQSLLLLSGGERCLTAIALLFAILKLRPTPFCVLDEIEAALDDANVLRFTAYIRRYTRDSQFILVTHRKGTMEASDRLYGVTMQERGISRVLSMQLD